MSAAAANSPQNELLANGFSKSIEEWRPAYNPWIIALVVTMATFMEVLDTSIANVSLPHIAGSLSASEDESTWVLTSYLVANAVVLPLNGWLTALLGRKRFYMMSVALFTISSFLCGMAPSLNMLVFFRVLQGFGGGGLQPAEQAILMDTFPRKQRGMSMAVYGIAVVTAPVIGPTLGGWITDNFSWRWVFLINIPIGILSLLLTSQLVQDPPFLKRKKWSAMKIDYIGLGLIAVGLGLAQFVLDKGQRNDWFESSSILVFTIIAAVALVFACVWEWRVEEPIVDLHLLRDKNFAISNLLMFTLGFTLYSSTMLLPLFMQGVMGYTAARSGMAISPGGLVTMMLLPFVGLMVTRIEPRWLVMTGFGIISYSLIKMSRFSTDITFGMAVQARMVQALGLSLIFVPINSLAYHFLPKEKNNAAAGLINLSRNLGGSVGIAFVTTMLARRMQFHQSMLSCHLTPYQPSVQSALAQTARQLTAHGIHPAVAAMKAQGMLYDTLGRQASVLAYVDDFRLMSWGILAIIPLLLLMKRIRPGKGEVPVH